MWKEKKSKIHGTGVTATKDIKKGTKIIQYIGEKVSKKEGDRRSADRIKKYLNKKNEGSVYIFELNKKYDIDGSPLYNKARYINHSCKPNCEVEIINNEIWIISITKIIKGEELNYDYGYQFDSDDYKDHVCRCGKRNCIGYIISQDNWKKFKKYEKSLCSKKNIKKTVRRLLINQEKIIAKPSILCIGDIILDHNVHGRIDRVSPEAPVPIFLLESENYQLGGVGNVARNIVNLGGNATLLYLSGKKGQSRIIKKLIQKEKNIKNIEIKVEGFRVPIKTRYKNKLKQIIRVDNEVENFKLDKKYKDSILTMLNREIRKYKLVVLSDYSKGLLDKDLIQNVIKIAKKYNIKIIADPKKIDLNNYANINLLTPNEKEITDAAKKKYLNEIEIIKFSKKIIQKHHIDNILITRSDKGMLLVSDKGVYNFKANAKKVFDVTGAGDTVIATLAVMLSMGFNEQDSAIISNYAAGLVVGKFGTEVVKFKDLLN